MRRATSAFAPVVQLRHRVCRTAHVSFWLMFSDVAASNANQLRRAGSYVKTSWKRSRLHFPQERCVLFISLAQMKNERKLRHSKRIKDDSQGRQRAVRLTLLKVQLNADINVGTVFDNGTARFLNNCINKILQERLSGDDSEYSHTHEPHHFHCRFIGSLF
jgi:hypothetical protein